MDLFLASASARRRDLLAAAGVPFAVDPVDADETRRPGEPPDAHVLRVAREKAEAGRTRHAADAVLAADTVVLVDDLVLGKPASDADAMAMLERLSGRAHDVLTGVALIWPGHARSAIDRTRVWFTPIAPEEVAWYVNSGEPRDKAGAYAIQGLASRFVARIEGSYSNVVGLPVAVVLQLLREIGLDRPR